MYHRLYVIFCESSSQVRQFYEDKNWPFDKSKIAQCHPDFVQPDDMIRVPTLDVLCDRVGWNDKMNCLPKEDIVARRVGEKVEIDNIKRKRTILVAS